MNIALVLFITLFSLSDELVVDVPAPQYRIEGARVMAEDSDFINTCGAPRLPCRNLTLALPPGAVVESVSFHGNRTVVERVDIPPTGPVIPMNGGAMESFQNRVRSFYSSDAVFPKEGGALLSRGGIRKYTVVRVACYHFAYQPVSGKLHVAPEIKVKIRYTLPEIERPVNDVTFDGIAKGIIFNWDDARNWYRTDSPVEAKGYYIIVPASLANAMADLAVYRMNQGYAVNLVTREYIEANTAGVDVPQKIRNFLRENMAEIKFALLVGFSTDMPWRSLVPFNNDLHSPYQDPDISPIPGDIYYADLTDPDHLSWNSDGDDHYGEVYDGNFLPNGDDDPDYHPDIHLGRIPFSSTAIIKDICAKTIAFDSNKDHAYKTASLLTGSIYYFDNENNGGNDRLDGADFMEELMNESVLKRSNAVYLYETDGLNPCVHPCTAPLTRANHIAFWQKKGIMYECHHGNYNIYARKVWGWDDGDGIPENNEIQWPTSLHISDVYQLDNAYPATTYLRSCLCGKPEVNNLGAELLRRGSSAVICSSRIAWLSLTDMGGMPYHFFERLMKRSPSSEGVVGIAHDLSRIDFMEASGFWIPVYHYNLFGDPALRQFGRLITIKERAVGGIHP